jgi:hypothetical protein
MKIDLNVCIKMFKLYLILRMIIYIYIYIYILLPLKIGVTKEIISRGPQVADMECRELDWPAEPTGPLFFMSASSFITNINIHYIVLVQEDERSCFMR